MKLAQLFQLTNLIAELKNKKVICYLSSSIQYNVLGHEPLYAQSFFITHTGKTISLAEDINQYLEELREYIAKLDKEAA